MTGVSCYVIGAAEWNAAMESLGIVILLGFVSVWAAGIDWWRVHDLYRMHARRRRRAKRQHGGSL